MTELISGIIAGMFTGTGMGGGTILILLLSMLLSLDQHSSQAINLVFFILTSISAIIINIKGKLIDFKLGYKIIIYGVIGAIIGSRIAMKINSENLRKYFGIFLGIIAIYEIYSLIKEYIKERKKK
ncbi:MAG: sulfite exporter TauE/SafE family protein [Clostridia bacterium]|nr:sulfite exporter TauE/SafE family protein [Clostridia bacterium]